MKYIPRFTKEDIEENHKQFNDRVQLYKNLGFDFTDSRKFIIKKSKPSRGKMLEIGCGNGYMTLELARSGYKFVSVDSDEDAVRKTALNLAYENLHTNVEFYVMDGKRLSFVGEYFDNIIVVNLFHHITDIDDMLLEMDRVLLPNGKIVMADFNNNGMGIINSVHKKEGRIHEDCGVTKGHVFSYYKGLGYELDEHDDKYHWVLIAQKRIQQ